MKSNKILTDELEKLKSQEINYGSLNNLSILQFIKYKRILSKERKINTQLAKNNLLGNKIRFWYNSQTKSWIDNPKISCRKYFKMEQRAQYKKNLLLYKLGIINQKPLPPMIHNINNSLYPIKDFFKNTIKPLLIKCNFFRKIYDKYDFFKSQILPQKINNLAINTASIGIKGYRTLQSDCRFIRSSVSSKNSFKYLKCVIQEANNRLDNSEKTNSFKNSLKIENFKSNDIYFNTIKNENISKIYSNNTKHTISNFRKKDIAEYSL
jgi:hypothetical protein